MRRIFGSIRPLEVRALSPAGRSPDPNGIQGARVQTQELYHRWGDLSRSTKEVMVRAWIEGFDTNSMTFVSSIAKPPCSDCFFLPPVESSSDHYMVMHAARPAHWIA